MLQMEVSVPTSVLPLQGACDCWYVHVSARYGPHCTAIFLTPLSHLLSLVLFSQIQVYV